MFQEDGVTRPPKPPQPTLHTFDLLLSRYICGCLGGYAFLDSKDDRLFRRALKEALTPMLCDFILSDNPSDLLLGRTELDEIVYALEDLPTPLPCSWVPWEFAHGVYLNTLPEIGTLLSPATRDAFAENCVHWIRQLSADNTDLHAGVVVVAEWIDAVRRLKRGLGWVSLLPAPEGSFPTPAHPSPLALVSPACPSPLPSTTVSASLPTVTVAAKDACHRRTRPEPGAMSTSEVATHYGVGEDKVRGWISKGELPALNLATSPGGRPRYAITAEALEKFEQCRAAGTSARQLTTSARRTSTTSGAIRFY